MIHKMDVFITTRKCTRKSFSYDIHNFFSIVLDGLGLPIEHIEIIKIDIKKCPICKQIVFPKYVCEQALDPCSNAIFVCSTCSTICGVDILILPITIIGAYSFISACAYINGKKINDNYLLCSCVSNSKELRSRYFFDPIITFIIGMSVIIPNEIITYILRFIY